MTAKSLAADGLTLWRTMTLRKSGSGETSYWISPGRSSWESLVHSVMPSVEGWPEATLCAKTPPRATSGDAAPMAGRQLPVSATAPAPSAPARKVRRVSGL